MSSILINSRSSSSSSLDRRMTRRKTWFNRFTDMVHSIVPRKMTTDIREDSRRNTNVVFETLLNLESYSMDVQTSEAEGLPPGEMLVLKSLNSQIPLTMNLYEAFGITDQRLNCEPRPPLLVIELIENGLVQRYQVPQKHSLDGRWMMFGRHLYVHMGHAFVERRTKPQFLFCAGCLKEDFRLSQDYFQCIDCRLAVPNLETKISNCRIARTITQDMNFPYDPIIKSSTTVPNPDYEAF